MKKMTENSEIPYREEAEGHPDRELVKLQKDAHLKGVLSREIEGTGTD